MLKFPGYERSAVIRMRFPAVGLRILKKDLMLQLFYLNLKPTLRKLMVKNQMLNLFDYE